LRGWQSYIKAARGDCSVPQRWAEDSNEVMDDLEFSPVARFLAAGSHDNYIYVHELGGEVSRLHSVCKGHSSYITHIDWSADRRYL
jgi:WD40 repeat protein